MEANTSQSTHKKHPAIKLGASSQIRTIFFCVPEDFSD